MRTPAIAVLSLLLLAAVAESSDPSCRVGDSVAVTLAIRAMGLEDIAEWQGETAGRTATLETMVDSIMPFLKLNGRSVYRVLLTDVPVAFKAIDSTIRVVSHKRDFVLFVDAEAGTILKVESTLPSYEDKIKHGEIRRPTRNELETYFGPKGIRIIDVVLGTPHPAFLTALGTTAGRRDADQIVGIFVDYEDPAILRRNVWIIETCGHVGSYGDTYERTIVDAGGMLYTTNTPVPVE
jgi:hypothetical protein